jgi:soluble lytic murein transglycosylase-like protein
VAAIGEDARAASASGGSDAEAGWEDVLEAAGAFGEGCGPAAPVRLWKLEALEALGRDAELLRECADFRSAFPGEAAGESEAALLYYEAVSGCRLGKVSWAGGLKRLAFGMPVTEWTRKAYAFLGGLEPEPPDFSPAEMCRLRMRLAVADRDYGLAYRAALGARPLVFSREASRETVAELGKAWLYSGESKEGLGLFPSVWGDYPGDKDGVARSEAETGAAWVASFYRARFLRALDRDAEARKLFLLLASSAPSEKDGDAALWYALDSGIEAKKASQAAAAKALGRRAPSEAKRAAELRRSSFGLLCEASALWKDPSAFDDPAEDLLLEALAARDWPLVFDMASSLSPRLSPALGAKLSYIAGRSLELGLYAPPVPSADGPASSPAPGLGALDGSPSPGGAAEGFYRAVLDREGASLYYRLLAGRRLGEPPAILPAAGDASGKPARERAPAGAGDASAGELEKFIIGFIEFGQAGTAFAELDGALDIARGDAARPGRAPEGEALGPAALRRLAEAFARGGDYASSMRTVLAMFALPGWSQDMATRRDYELLYPRPFLDQYRGIRPRRDLPEYVFYGLLRSESYFRPSIASEAGAVGLAQIMPSTAKELARGLGMRDYDLKRPLDSLRMGSSYFAELLGESDGHPLKAMFAYNAGRGRLRRWIGAGGSLPDDLLLETLDIEETRQYGRNILQASVFYGELYYGMSGIEAIDGVLGEKS